MLRRERAPACRGAGLKQHRRALRRRLAQMDCINPEMRPLVPHAMDVAGVGKAVPAPVTQYGPVLPASLPQLVDRLHVVLSDLVTIIVGRLLRQTHAAGGAFQVAGDDVPADPPL